MFVLYEALKATPYDDAKAKDAVKQAMADVLAQHSIAANYNVLVFYDELPIARSDADSIYQAVASFTTKKPILLVIYSGGGAINAGYHISKLCHDYASGKFIVAVPREAKSAATLICCGADELHMGALSELGPIDPQIDSSPALGLKYAVEHLADLVKRYPAASEMFADYLHRSLNLINLGYYERVAESAVQYAERLLERHAANLQKKTPKEIAQHLVYFYKDHGFVIDHDEAKSIFGDTIIKSNTDEYKLANEIYEQLAIMSRVAEMAGYWLALVGLPSSNCTLRKKK